MSASRGVAAQDAAPALSSARVTAQVVGGTLAAPIAFFGTGIATKADRPCPTRREVDERAGRAAYVGAYTGSWLAAAAVPAAIAGDGRFPAALGGWRSACSLRPGSCAWQLALARC